MFRDLMRLYLSGMFQLPVRPRDIDLNEVLRAEIDPNPIVSSSVAIGLRNPIESASLFVVTQVSMADLTCDEHVYEPRRQVCAMACLWRQSAGRKASIDVVRVKASWCIANDERGLTPIRHLSALFD
jgi:hypothetical protein